MRKLSVFRILCVFLQIVSVAVLYLEIYHHNIRNMAAVYV